MELEHARSCPCPTALSSALGHIPSSWPQQAGAAIPVLPLAPGARFGFPTGTGWVAGSRVAELRAGSESHGCILAPRVDGLPAPSRAGARCCLLLPAAGSPARSSPGLRVPWLECIEKCPLAPPRGSPRTPEGDGHGGVQISPSSGSSLPSGTRERGWGDQRSRPVLPPGPPAARPRWFLSSVSRTR